MSPANQLGIGPFRAVLCICAVRWCECEFSLPSRVGTRCRRCDRPLKDEDEDEHGHGCGEHGAAVGVRLVCAGCDSPPFPPGDPRLGGQSHRFSCSLHGKNGSGGQVVLTVRGVREKGRGR